MQSKISGYFGRYRSLFPGSRDLIHIESTSDDDVPILSRIIQQNAVGQPVGKKHQQCARDGTAVIVANRNVDSDAGSKRQRFVGEAEESSAQDDYDDHDSDDSFIVPDHTSDSSPSPSERVPVSVQLRSVCSMLRNRRQCVQCAQCLRFMHAISVFVTEINTAVNSNDVS